LNKYLDWAIQGSDHGTKRAVLVLFPQKDCYSALPTGLELFLNLNTNMALS